jgi:hypothetical protein
VIAIPKVCVDPDLADFARADPTLLAIADALTVAAPATIKTPNRARRRSVSYAAAATVVVIAAAVPSIAFSRGLQQFLGLVSSPPAARNWVQATLTSPVRHAPPGSTIVIRWKLWSRAQNGQLVPFNAIGLFARIVNPAHTQATTAPAHGRGGRYSARIRVPPGGIGRLQVGISGWAVGPTGRKPAPNLFPITNYP